MIPNIIHKTERTERKENLLRELKEQGIESYNIWEGVYSPNSTMEGINLAHKQIVEWAKNERLEKVLIFEDDIKFTDKGAWKYFLNNEPKEYDIYLGGIYLGVINEGLVSAFTALHCYVVHSRFYDKFLSVKSDLHLDHALADGGKYIVCEPMIAVQYNGWSDNSAAVCNYDNIISQRKLFTLQNQN